MALRSVLVLTYLFPPSSAAGTHRLLGFSRHLPKYGWRCVVVAPPTLPWEPSDPALLDRLSPETTLYHVPYPSGAALKPLRKVAPYSVWLPAAWAACRRAIRDHRPAAIFTSGPPHVIHLLGRHIRRRTGLPWLADFRDPWRSAGALEDQSGWLRRWETWAEEAVFQDADCIIANTKGAQEALSRAFPQHAAKMTAITNGYDVENFASIPIPVRDEAAFQILHPGELYVNRDPEPFLKAIRSICPDDRGNDRSIRVRFVGRSGPGAERLNGLIHSMGLDEVVASNGQIPYAQSLEEMVRADLLLLLDSPGRRIGVPAKIFEYIGSNRPILALAEPDGDVARILGESGAPHRIAAQHDVQGIAAALKELLSRPRSSRLVDGLQMRTPRFTREALSGSLANLLDSCLGQERRSAEAAPAATSLIEARR